MNVMETHRFFSRVCEHANWKAQTKEVVVNVYEHFLRNLAGINRLKDL